MWEVHWSFPGVWYWPTAGLVLTYCGFGGGMRELPRGLVLTHCGFGG